MKNIKLSLFVMLLLSYGGVQSVVAQTDTEKKLKELKARRAVAKEVIGDGTDNLHTLEREANVGEDPCTLYDDDVYYTGFNQKSGTQGDPNLANTLLRITQQQLKDKIGGKYHKIISDYADQMDIDGQSSAVSHIEEAGDMVIDKMLGDTKEFCRKTSNPDGAGNIIMYMSIRISKKNLVDNVSRELSTNKELGVRFNEAKFRESALKVFDQDKQESE